MISRQRDAFVRVEERSQVGEARRRVTALATGLDFDEVAAGRTAIVTTEIASNLLDHAGGGDLFARPVPVEGTRAVELLAVDRGPGIPDIEQALRDGFSTGASSGVGLGAVARMADDFHIDSTAGRGTVLSALVLPRPYDSELRGALALPGLGALRRTHPLEQICGDGWAARDEEGGVVVMAVIDGLGHGPGAAEAAEAAVASFEHHERWDGPAEAVRRMHEALRGTRGAAVGVLELDRARQRIRFTGVGNVIASVLGEEKRTLLSRNGTVGLQMRRLEEYEVDCSGDCVVVMHSDGVSGRWGIDEARPLLGRPPSLLAGALYLEGYRGRDDATVVVLNPRRELGR